MSRFRYTRALTALLSLSSLFAVVSSQPVIAAETPYWYDVEVALIGYQDSQEIDHETWPEVIAKDSPAIDDVNQGDEKAEETAPWAWIDWWNDEPSKDSLFNVQSTKKGSVELRGLGKPFNQYGPAFPDKMAKFGRAKGMTVLWSQKWRQPIQAKKQASSSDNAIAINFKAPLNLIAAIKKGEALDEVEISGKIYLYRSRYLHFVSELQIQHWRTLEKNHGLDKGLSSPHSSQSFGQSIIPSSSSSPLTTINKIPLRAAHVNQSRRMRSNELHYIDHPMLGIVVRVTPADYGIEPLTETP
ncbi:MAG: hypothetical protein JKY50_11875 [Oleispira sp.]|nr:hypothetical protein [Oleispira sp.]